MRSADTWAQGNRPAVIAAFDPDGEPVALRAGGADSTITVPEGAKGWPAEAARGSPPMPMFPSSTTTEPRRSPGGSKIDRVSTGAPRRPASALAAGEVSTPMAIRPLDATASTMRPGPQPTSITGAVRSSRSSISRASALRRHASTSNGRTSPSVLRRTVVGDGALTTPARRGATSPRGRGRSGCRGRATRRASRRRSSRRR